MLDYSLIVNLVELCVLLPRPLIYLITFQDLDMSAFLSWSSIKSCSRFLKSEVNLLFKVLHFSLFSSVGSLA